MYEINRLDPKTASKIAAGEVVDRPLNVVKELVENAADAGATRITVDIKGGGAESIVITDDGKGIQFGELALAVERFATSKVKRVEDVYNISTYGFRGEALAAIGAVSKFSLRSVRDGGQAGEISVDYGVVSTPKPYPISKGTQVSVNNLFDNLPVRKKFLKSPRSNEAEILRFIKHFAMINAGLELIAKFEEKEIFRTYSADSAQQIAKRVFDEDRVRAGEFTSNNISVSVCVTHPAIQRKRRDAIYIGVNGRVIKDQTLSQAVVQAYHRLMPQNTYPSAIVDIRVAPSMVDVNIHPTKSEVRFDTDKNSLLFGFVIKAVQIALDKFTSAVYAVEEEQLNSDLVEEPVKTISKADFLEAQKKDPFLKNLSYHKTDETKLITKELEYPASSRLSVFELTKNQISSVSLPDPMVKSPQIKDVHENMSEISSTFKVIGQLNNTYIVCESPMGDLVVIDQHVAHERVLYEKYLADSMQSTPSITLFEPVVLSLTAEEMELLDEIASELVRFGYGYELFGPEQIKITTVPTAKLRKDTEKEFMGIIHDAMDNRKSRTQDYAIVTMSCKNAIKAGDSLSLFEMQHLVDTLFSTPNPHTCPHGRPIIFMLPLSELNKKFQRQ